MDRKNPPNKKKAAASLHLIGAWAQGPPHQTFAESLRSSKLSEEQQVKKAMENSEREAAVQRAPTDNSPVIIASNVRNVMGVAQAPMVESPVNIASNVPNVAGVARASTAVESPVNIAGNSNVRLRDMKSTTPLSTRTDSQKSPVKKKAYQHPPATPEDQNQKDIDIEQVGSSFSNLGVSRGNAADSEEKEHSNEDREDQPSYSMKDQLILSTLRAPGQVAHDQEAAAASVPNRLVQNPEEVSQGQMMAAGGQGRRVTIGGDLAPSSSSSESDSSSMDLDHELEVLAAGGYCTATEAPPMAPAPPTAESDSSSMDLDHELEVLAAGGYCMATEAPPMAPAPPTAAAPPMAPAPPMAQAPPVARAPPTAPAPTVARAPPTAPEARAPPTSQAVAVLDEKKDLLTDERMASLRNYTSHYTSPVIRVEKNEPHPELKVIQLRPDHLPDGFVEDLKKTAIITNYSTTDSHVREEIVSQKPQGYDEHFNKANILDDELTEPTKCELHVLQVQESAGLHIEAQIYQAVVKQPGLKDTFRCVRKNLPQSYAKSTAKATDHFTGTILELIQTGAALFNLMLFRILIYNFGSNTFHQDGRVDNDEMVMVKIGSGNLDLQRGMQALMRTPYGHISCKDNITAILPGPTFDQCKTNHHYHMGFGGPSSTTLMFRTIDGSAMTQDQVLRLLLFCNDLDNELSQHWTGITPVEKKSIVEQRCRCIEIDDLEKWDSSSLSTYLFGCVTDFVRAEKLKDPNFLKKSYRQMLETLVPTPQVGTRFGPTRSINLYRWLINYRHLYQDGSLTQDQCRILEELGIADWKTTPPAWKGFVAACTLRDFKDKNPDIDFNDPSKFKFSSHIVDGKLVYDYEGPVSGLSLCGKMIQEYKSRMRLDLPINPAMLQVLDSLDLDLSYGNTYLSEKTHRYVQLVKKFHDQDGNWVKLKYNQTLERRTDGSIAVIEIAEDDDENAYGVGKWISRLRSYRKTSQNEWGEDLKLVFEAFDKMNPDWTASRLVQDSEWEKFELIRAFAFQNPGVMWASMTYRQTLEFNLDGIVELKDHTDTSTESVGFWLQKRRAREVQGVGPESQLLHDKLHELDPMWSATRTSVQARGYGRRAHVETHEHVVMITQYHNQDNGDGIKWVDLKRGQTLVLENGVVVVQRCQRDKGIGKWLYLQKRNVENKTVLGDKLQNAIDDLGELDETWWHWI